MTISALATMDGTNNFRDSYSPALGAVISRTLGEHGALYLEPIWVNNSNLQPSEVVDDNDSMLLGVGARIRVRPTLYSDVRGRCHAWPATLRTRLRYRSASRSDRVDTCSSWSFPTASARPSDRWHEVRTTPTTGTSASPSHASSTDSPAIAPFFGCDRRLLLALTSSDGAARRLIRHAACGELLKRR